MSNAKILLPEPTAPRRSKSSRKARSSTSSAEQKRRNAVFGLFDMFSNPGNSKCVRMNTDASQRSEAAGLVMVGFSAFSISLLHYATAAQSYPLIQSVMVNFGVGVYIIPSLIGLLGIQKFLERPFTNLWWRLGGCLGVTVTAMGLLGTEGGKLGAHIFTSFTNFFGTIPTYLLLCTGLASSMIFALDILYKDVLKAVVVVAALLTKVAMFLWEVTLTLVSKGIEAIKLTSNFIAALFSRVKNIVTSTWKKTEEDSNSPASALTNLTNMLAFKRKHAGEEPEESKKDSESTAEEENVIESVARSAEVDRTEDQNKEVSHETQEDFQTFTQVTVAAVPGICVAEMSMHPIEIAEEEQSATPLPFAPEQVTVTEIHQAAEVPSQEMAEETAEVTAEVMEEKADDQAETVTEAEIIEEAPKQADIIPFKKAEPAEAENLTAEETISEEEALPQIIESEEAVEEEETEVMVINTINATKKPTESVYLDDNPIDREIKSDEGLDPGDIDILLKEGKIAHEAVLPKPEDILKVPKPRNADGIKADLEKRSVDLIKTLTDFGIKATITDVVFGPAISRFELKPAPGVKVSKITALTDDMALALSAQSIRIEAPIPGKPAIGIEIPNKEPTPVYFYELIHNDKFTSAKPLLTIALGETINGQAVYADLADMPHLLIAGSTGSGKSVCVNTIIASILFRANADQVKFIMIDPKMVELSSYNGIPHMIAPVVTDPQKAGDALLWAQEEMTRRYTLLAECGCKKLESYNERLSELREEVNPNLEPMPMIVIVIDELADLMMTARDKVETTICRLAQMARAVGIHLIIATQRPSVDVLTGLIKANLPTRIAFSVASAVDSKTILDSKGAERLIGKGDMLFIPKGRNKPLRVQGAFVSDGELKKLVDFVKLQGEPEYVDIQPIQTDEDDEEEDNIHEAPANSDAELIERIVNYLETQEKTSTSMLQRKFRIGYNRAARIMDQLEEQGMVTPTDGSNKRRVLIGRSISQL